MGRLRRVVDEAERGVGRLVVVVGEAGIGKTRLLEEATRYAVSRGRLALWGRCHRDAGLPPYWPWRQVLSRLVQVSEASSVQRWAGPKGSLLDRLLYESDGVAESPGPDAAEDGESARFRLSETLERFLRGAARERPLLLVLDDLHWADQPSLRMLEFIARDLDTIPLVVLAGCREEEGAGIAGLLSRLTRERSFERLDLSALDRLAVEKLVALSNDLSTRADWVDLLWQTTQGNPLYLVEILRGRPGGADRTRERLSDWPGVRAAIRQRLESLSPPCRELLEEAAALGTEFTADMLAAVVGTRILPVLDEAAARVVMESADRPGVFRFGHPLVQEALSTQPPASRRAEVHARIAKTLETRYGETQERHAAELAHHFELAGSIAAAGKVAHYSRIAGEQALASFATEEAMRHFRTGLVGGATACDETETAWLRFGLARTLAPPPYPSLAFATDDADGRNEAFSALSAAFDHFVTVGDVGSALTVAQYPMARVRRWGEWEALFNGPRVWRSQVPSRKAGSALCRAASSFAKRPTTPPPVPCSNER